MLAHGRKRTLGSAGQEYYVHELHYALISLRINPFLGIFVLKGFSCAKQSSYCNLQFTMHIVCRKLVPWVYWPQFFIGSPQLLKHSGKLHIGQVPRTNWTAINTNNNEDNEDERTQAKANSGEVQRLELQQNVQLRQKWELGKIGFRISEFELQHLIGGTKKSASWWSWIWPLFT